MRIFKPFRKCLLWNNSPNWLKWRLSKVLWCTINSVKAFSDKRRNIRRISFVTATQTKLRHFGSSVWNKKSACHRCENYHKVDKKNYTTSTDILCISDAVRAMQLSFAVFFILLLTIVLYRNRHIFYQYKCNELLKNWGLIVRALHDLTVWQRCLLENSQTYAEVMYSAAAAVKHLHGRRGHRSRCL